MNECYICHAKVGESHKEYCSVSPGVMMVDWCRDKGSAAQLDMEDRSRGTNYDDDWREDR